MLTSRFPSSGGQKINNSVPINVVATDQIKIGDTVYTVKNDPRLDGEKAYVEKIGDVDTAAFSPDGTTLVLGGDFTGKSKVYSVSGTTIIYVSDIYADSDGTALCSVVNTAAFSPDGTTLVLGGSFTGYAKVYSVSGTTITYVSDIYADGDGTALGSVVNTAVFSPDGTTLVLGGYFDGKAKVYSVSGTTITYVSDIYADGDGTALSGYVYTAAFSPDGTTLVLGGTFTGKSKVYSVSGTTITYVSDIDDADLGAGSYVTSAVFSPDGTTLVIGEPFYCFVCSVSGNTIAYVDDIYDNNNDDLFVTSAVFSPDGTTLVIGSGFAGKSKVYSVSGTTITYVSDIYADGDGTALGSVVNTAVFSPDGTTLVLGGSFAGSAKVYSASGTTITYVSDIGKNGTWKTTALSGYVDTAAFSPDGTTLVLGGSFTGYAKVYSVSGTTITYVSDIYADGDGAALKSSTMSYCGVNTAIFSPDGATLVLGGNFDGEAKVYSVSGTTITYVSDIYADGDGTALGSVVNTAVFSPDGTTLVLGGSFTGYAKVYSVSGTTITYVSDIYADGDGTALGSVYTAVFSPDGTTLVLGGNFDGEAKVYSVSGTAITYVSDIYADGDGTALGSVVNTAVFSPDGTTLVLCGYFTGGAKVYSVNGTTITYVSDIYGGDGTAFGAVKTAAFSPHGTTLVLMGEKVYSVIGTTITYVSDIYPDSNGMEPDGQVSVFSPDGGVLVIGKIPYCVDEAGIHLDDIFAYHYTGGIIIVDAPRYGVGIAKSEMDVGERGSASVIAWVS